MKHERKTERGKAWQMKRRQRNTTVTESKTKSPDRTTQNQDKKPDRTRPTDGAGTLNSQTIGEVGKEQNSKALPAVESFMTVSI